MRSLNAQGNKIRSLQPLASAPIEDLGISDNPIESLDPVRSLPVKRLDISSTKISDLTGTEIMPLISLSCQETSIKNIDILRNKHLEEFHANDKSISDISVLKGMPLKELSMQYCDVNSLTPLKGMVVLSRLKVDGNPIHDLGPFESYSQENFTFDCKLNTIYMDKLISKWSKDSSFTNAVKYWSTRNAFVNYNSTKMKTLAKENNGRNVQVYGHEPDSTNPFIYLQK